MKNAQNKKLTCLEAAEIILRKANRPMKAKEIYREITRQQITEVGGETPWNTINARISEDIDRKNENSLFVRAKPGSYALKAFYEGSQSETQPKQPTSLRTHVLVFHADELEALGSFHGIRQDYETYVYQLLHKERPRFMSRLKAEGTEEFKQIVSYVLIKYKDQLLRFVRGKITSVSGYLYGQYSIGFGGHVEIDDWGFFEGDSGFQNSVFRELNEEVGINLNEWSEEDYELRPIGVLNDDSSPLGRRHFAFVHLLEVYLKDFIPGKDFSKKEKSVNELGLVNIRSFSDDFAGYEYWSKLAIQTFFASQLSTACHIVAKPNFKLSQNSDLILIVGFVGSGKTDACQLLVNEFGYTLVPCSKVMQSLIGCPSIEVIGRETLQEEGLKLVTSVDGHLKLAQSICDYMKKSGASKFVLDGLRYPETLEMLKRLLHKSIAIIYIETTIDRQYNYYKLREAAICNMREYLDLVSHPVEKAIERFVHEADIIVYNHGSRESYMNVLQAFLQRELNST